MNNIEEKSNEEVVDVKALQDTEADILSAYQADNKKIHFAGDNLKSLQKEMNGGLMCERLYLFGGVPGFGVTTLLNNLADNLCLDSHPVLFFSYGVGKSELRYRTFARFSKFAIQDFDNKDIKPDMIQKILIDPKIQTIEKFKYILEDRMGIEAWEPMIAQIQATHGEGPVMIIDNIRKIFTREAFNEERFRIEYILSNLMGFAKKYRIPIIASSELNRAHYTHQNISKGNWDLACLKESGALEYDAAWIGVITGEQYQKHLICLKANQGTGDIFQLPFAMKKNEMVIVEKENHKSSVINNNGFHFTGS